MSWYHPSTLLDKIFEGGIILKGIGGTLEFLGGLLLVFVSPTSLHSFIVFITGNELVESPRDPMVHFLLGWTEHLTNDIQLFLIVYLWVHAAAKLVAVIGILRNQLWAYPFSLITLGLMMVYQAYDIAVKASVGMIALTIFDVGMLWLIWREYGKAKQVLREEAPEELSPVVDIDAVVE